MTSAAAPTAGSTLTASLGRRVIVSENGTASSAASAPVRNAAPYASRTCSFTISAARRSTGVLGRARSKVGAEGSANATRSSRVRSAGGNRCSLVSAVTWRRACEIWLSIVPVNTAYRGEMLRHICNDSQSRHIITVPELAERLKALRLNLNIIDPSILPTGSADEPKLDGPIEPWDVHTIMYTSGTTGPTKGAIISYFKNYRDCDNWEGVATQDDTMLGDLPPFHVAGMSNAYAMLRVGGRVAVRTLFSGTRYWNVVRKCGATLSMMLGTMATFLESMPPIWMTRRIPRGSYSAPPWSVT